MTLSIYDILIPTTGQMLGGLSRVLAKGAAFAETRKVAPAVLLGSRLAPDMLPLSGQVQLATDFARRGAARLAGQTAPSEPDTETDFAELIGRVGRTLDYIRGVPEAAFEGAPAREMTVGPAGRQMTFTGTRFLLNFLIPNLAFHCTTAYAILRHNGVEVGKMDFANAAPLSV